MALDPAKWPHSPSPLRARQRLLKAVHVLRVAARTAQIEWKSVNREDDRQAIASNVTFRIEVEPDELDGGYVAACLDLPGCFADGGTEEEAVSNLVEAISGVMEARMQRHLREQPLHRQGDHSASRHRHTLEIPA